MRILVSTFLALALPWSASAAQECPSLGLSALEEKKFCLEFEELLYAPFDPKTDRSMGKRSKKKVEKILESDPLWGEVYRSDPKRTLELIVRIRNAGGLKY